MVQENVAAQAVVKAADDKTVADVQANAESGLLWDSTRTSLGRLVVGSQVDSRDANPRRGSGRGSPDRDRSKSVV